MLRFSASWHRVLWRISFPLVLVYVALCPGRGLGQESALRRAGGVTPVQTAQGTTASASQSLPALPDRDGILLNSGVLKPAKALQARKARAPFAGNRLYLVQADGPITAQWAYAVKQTGVRIVTHVPNHAYLVYGTDAQIDSLRSVPAIQARTRWDGHYSADLKTDQRTGAVMARNRVAVETYAIQLVDDAPANAATLKFIESVQADPMKPRSAVAGYRNVIARLAADKVPLVAAREDVVSIQLYTVPRLRDERQGQIAAGQLVGNLPSGPGYMAFLSDAGFTQQQFDASDFVVDVSDSGLDDGTTAPNHFGLYRAGDTTLASRVVYNRLEGSPNIGSTLQGCDGHGTLNAHVIGGFNNRTGFPHTDAQGYRYGLGIAPFVKLGSSVIFDPDFTFPDYSALQARAYTDKVRVSSNSWGGDTAGDYTIDAQEYDALVRDARRSGSVLPLAGNQQMVIVFAAGNAGPTLGSVGSPGTAKNVITVGASENVHSHAISAGGLNSAGADGCLSDDTDANSANDMAEFSSRGPCADGRIKPDIVAPGTHITGGVVQDDTVPSPTGSGTASTCFDGTGVCRLPGGGTSGSISNFFPQGQQFYTTSSGTSHSTPAIAGGAALLRQFFINAGRPAPSPSMTKAFLANSARYMTGVSAGDTLPSPHQGMGCMNLGTAFDGIARVLHDEIPQETLSATGQFRTITGTIVDSTKPFRVTLAYTDAPGSTVGSAFNNDLDLEVLIGGQLYRGNRFSGALSIPGGSPDFRNNLESVYLPAGLVGTFQVIIRASEINSDGVPGNDQPLDQDFSLVVYNGIETPAPVFDASIAIGVETCANGVADPNETVSLRVTLNNIGTQGTTTLVATPMASPSVTNVSGAMAFGAVNPGGASVTRSFSFVPVGACGSIISIRLQLQDGDTNLGQIEVPLRLGLVTVTPILSENFDSLTPPTLPAGWSTTGFGAQPAWETVPDGNSPPNGVFSPDSPSFGENQLISPLMQLLPGENVLRFFHIYDFEATYDGGVLELEIDSGGFEDIVEAGGEFLQGGYSGTIEAIGDAPGWSGISNGFGETLVRLPDAAAGRSIRLRWRTATDAFVGAGGWIIDDVVVQHNALECCGYAGTLTFDSPAVRALEDAGMATLIVRRSAGALGAVSVNYSFTPGSATSADFNATPGTVQFADGQTSAIIQVPVINDSELEGRQTFSVTLSNPTGGAFIGERDRTVVTIDDRDDGFLLSHSVSQGIAPGNSVSCNGPSGQDQNRYYRSFFLSDFDVPGSLAITSVQFGVESAISGSGDTQPLSVRIYTNSGDPFPGGTLTQLVNADVQLPNVSNAIVTVPLAATVPAGSELVMELFVPSGNTNGTFFFIGSNSLGQSAPGFIQAPGCGLPAPETLTSVGFPGVHIIMNVLGIAGPEVDHVPVAVDDFASTREGVSISVPVLDNDTGLEDAPITLSIHGMPVGGTALINVQNQIIFTPDIDFNGTAVVLYRVTDSDGDTALGALEVMVENINDRPTLDVISTPQPVFEDTIEQSVALTGISAGPNEDQVLTVSAATDNPAFFSSLSVGYASPASEGTVFFTPAPHAFGSATITVTVSDDGGTENGGMDRRTRSFLVQVLPINDAPTIDFIADPPALQEDSPARSVMVTGITAGPAESQTLQVFVESSNPELIPQPTVSYASPQTTALLSFTPTPNAFGTAVITVTVMDDGGTADGGTPMISQSFTVTVDGINDAPLLNPIPDQAQLLEDAAPQSVALTGINTGGGENQGISIVATSSNPTVFPDPTILYTSPEAVGTLVYQPALHQVGSATITVTLRDDGGTALGGTDVIVRTFKVSVKAVNDAPTMLPIPDPAPILEDAALQTVTFDGVTAGGDEIQVVTVRAVSSNPALIPNPTVNYRRPNLHGNLTYKPVANASGEAVITVTISDSGGTASGGVDTLVRTFRVAVVAVNDPPTIDAIAPLPTILEDAPTQHVVLSGISAGGSSEMQTILLEAVSDNPLLIPHPTISYISPATTAQLSFTPVANASGVTTIRVTTRDDGGTANGGTATLTRQFTVTVAAVNDPPTVAPIPDPVSLREDATTLTIPIHGISAGIGESQGISVTSTSSDPALIPHPIVIYTSPGATASLALTPLPQRNGSAVITVQVRDNAGRANGGEDTTTTSFTVTVAAINDAPVFLKGPNVSINEDSGIRSIPAWAAGISAGGPDENGQQLSFELLAEPQSLFAEQPSITPDGTLSFIPAANANGTANVTVILRDSGGVAGGGIETSAAQTFSITVQAVNDAPSFIAGPDQNAAQNAEQIIVPHWATSIIPGPADESTQTLNFSLTPENPALFAIPPTVSSDGTLTYTPATNASGGTRVAVVLRDSGGTARGGIDASATQSFLITTRFVNDAPEFIAGPDVVVAQDAGPQRIPSWATGIRPGPEDEAAQVLQFRVHTYSPELFAVAPAIAPNGTLTFTPAPNGSGIAFVEVSLRDNGGVAGGGRDQSRVQKFEISITTFAEELGSYHGLALPPSGQPVSHSQTGSCRVVITRNGNFTGRLSLGEMSFGIRGAFDKSGVAHFAPTDESTLSLPRRKAASLALTLRVDVAGDTGLMQGTVLESERVFAQVECDRAIYTAKVPAPAPFRNVPAAFPGGYTGIFAALPPVDQGRDAASYPQGDGIATLVVRKDGTTRLVAKLADGTAASSSGMLSGQNRFPLYLKLHRGQGSLSGFIQLRSQANLSDADAADLLWFRPQSAKGTGYYPAGWSTGIRVDFLASRYSPPAAGTPPLPDIGSTPPNATVFLTDGDLDALGLTSPIFISEKSDISILRQGPERLDLRIARGSGKVTGTFLHPATGRKVGICGILLQKPGILSGYFLHGTESGRIFAQPLEN